MGIRLFNREQGRGGAGIDAMDKDSRMLAKAMVRDIDREAEFFADRSLQRPCSALLSNL